jgi:hypothetical protein
MVSDQPLSSGELSPGELEISAVVLEVQETSARIRIKCDPRFMDEGDAAYWLVTR